MSASDTPSDGGDGPSSDADPQETPAIERFLSGIGSAVGRFTYNFTPITPFKTRIWKWFALRGMKNYHKVTGGDAIGVNAKPGQRLELVPVKFLAADKRDGGKPGWKAQDRDKVWSAGSEGNVVDYLYGKIPVVLLDDDDHVEAGWLKSRIGEALELGQHGPVFTEPQIQHLVNVPADALGDPEVVGDGNEAATDGGAMSLAQFNQLSKTQILDRGKWAEDNIIDLSSWEGDDGMRISHRKAKEWRGEVSDSEEIKRAEERGRQMEMLGKDGPSMAKLLLICAGIILGVLAIVIIGPQLLGSTGGGGGGGMIPLQAAVGAIGGA